MKEFGIKLNGVLIKLFNNNYKYFLSLSEMFTFLLFIKSS